MIEAWIGLGANLGDPVATLNTALERLDRVERTHLTAVSRFYRTPPWGDTDQPDFINAVAAVDTGLSAGALLEALHAIEANLGRVRGDRRWGPRRVDLDLLVFGDARIESPEVVVPHPRIPERAFVLVPLDAVAPGLTIPGQGRVDALLAALDDNERAGIKAGPQPEYLPAHSNRGA